jgi:hypothetical protein
LCSWDGLHDLEAWRCQGEFGGVLVEEGFEFGEDDEGFGVGAVLVFGGAVFDAGPVLGTRRYWCG